MKIPKLFSKALVSTGFKSPPRRRGPGKKTLAKLVSARPALETSATTTTAIAIRGYKEVAGVGGINSDWAITQLSEDADVSQNIFYLRSRSRDLFRTDVYFKKYKEELWANVFGSEGITCRLRVKETEDRVVYAPDEKGVIDAFWRRRDRVAKYVERRFGRKVETRAGASIQVGDLDLYANKTIEDAWDDWKRREYCTVSGVLSYNEVCQIRLISAARDGDFFIRHVRDPAINDYGYSLQLINSEWCDYSLNGTTSNGGEVRMGIERDRWGRRVAYFFLKRNPGDWQYSAPVGLLGVFNPIAKPGQSLIMQGDGGSWTGMGGAADLRVYERVPAEEIIHYARYEDGDSTRPAPWSAAVIPKSRHLDKYEEAEVVAARVAACKLGFFTSNMVPEGGMAVADMPDPTKAGTMDAEPGGFEGLPWGIDFKNWDPTHPNGNFDLFRKGMLRAWCAGMPGANYNIIANDLEGVNYSSGRLGMLDERELWKLIQKFDIEVAERPIFENWLYMSLVTGAIPLPLAKFDKFNQPVFRGRRWAWVDPMKEVQANALQVANKFTSRTRVIEDSDVDADFEEVVFELAEEEAMLEELGMSTDPAVGKVTPERPTTPADEGDPPADNSYGSAKALSPDKFERQLALAKARTPAINMPVTLPPLQMTVSVPEQKAPIVNITPAKAPIVKFEPKITVPEIKMPEIKSPDVVVNVAPPAVNIENKIDVPTTKNMKIKRDDKGNMTDVEYGKE